MSSNPSVSSSGRIFACFAFRLGSTAFTASLYFQLTCVLLSLIRRALHCGKVVFSFLIAKFVRKAACCGCYRIAVRILRFGQFWFALSMVLAFIINERPKDDYSVVRWGNAHALVPSAALPPGGTWVKMDISDDDAAGLVSFILDRYGGTEGSVSDRAAKRGAVPDHGATIVTHKRSIAGKTW